jgi:uncharacterized membrane protein YeaQ/YmgE (transglycosylase-associated protein family)
MEAKIMSVIWFIVFGLIIGLLARAILPGRQQMGVVPTTLLGCAGSLVGGLVGNLISGTSHDAAASSTAGFVGSLIGAVALLSAGMAILRSRHHHHGAT